MAEAGEPTPWEAEDAILDGLLAGVANARTGIAAMEALEVRLLATARQIAHDRIARIDEASSRAHEMPLRDIAAEFATALRVNDRAMQNDLSSAADIAAHLPLMLAALAEGRISQRHLRIAHESAAGLTDEALATFDARVVPLAEAETPNRLRPLARRIAEELHDVPLRARHADARAARGVFVRDLADGMSELVAVTESTLAHGIVDRLTEMAHRVRGIGDQGDARTIDQLRADILTDLLLTSTPTAEGPHAGGERIRARVHVTIPVGVITREADAGAELRGVGAIDGDTARHLAGDATIWTRVFTHPVSGCVLTVDRYRPSEEQRRLLRVRDEHCRFPGCRMPTHRCDIDHTVDYAHGGETHVDNLAHLCRRHHSLKHASRWAVKLAQNGELEWTSPRGRRHTDVPASRVRFTDADPPPF